MINELGYSKSWKNANVFYLSQCKNIKNNLEEHEKLSVLKNMAKSFSSLYRY